MVLMENGEDVTDTLESIEFDFEAKAENIAKLMAELTGNAESLKKEEERLYQRRKAIENNANTLKRYLETEMMNTGKTKFKTDLFSFGIQKNPPSLDISTEENIPDKYYVIERKLQRAELLKDIKTGVEVEGVELKQTEGLRIR